VSEHRSYANAGRYGGNDSRLKAEQAERQDAARRVDEYLNAQREQGVRIVAFQTIATDLELPVGVVRELLARWGDNGITP
jgi:hypothetical protein